MPETPGSDERTCSYDPLIELMARFENVKAVSSSADPFENLSLEDSLKKHIVDGIKRGLDDHLAAALEQYPPLYIINEILLGGMKTVGELFGAGKMQLPFVLQSAEVMKASVRYLEPHMEKSEGSEKGSILLATVFGDVHDIGKNLVDIILSNNGYRVVNIGIKQPINSILEQATKHNCQVIGMSGLLVKSTVIMRENLLEMNARQVSDFPVILGGAALTRGYVEHDLRPIYEGDVFYAQDAFEGLRLMGELSSEERGPQGEFRTGSGQSAAPKESKAEERSDAASATPLSPAREVGVSGSRRRGVEQSGTGKLANRERGTSGPSPQQSEEPAAAKASESEVQTDAASATPLSSARKVGELANREKGTSGPSAEKTAPNERVRSHRLDALDPELYVYAGVHSDVVPLESPPPLPFYGWRSNARFDVFELFKYVNPIALFRGQWQFKRPAGMTNQEFDAYLAEHATPVFDRMTRELAPFVKPQVQWAYYPCASDGNDLVVYEEDRATERLRFSFPRQRDGRRLCLSDFFLDRKLGPERRDTVGFSLVTIGSAVTDRERGLFDAGEFQDYLFTHGLGVETAEALAEYWHRQMRFELGIADQEPEDRRLLFSAKYHGARYSFGYPACPNIEDQAKLFTLLRPSEIGVTLTEEFMLSPEQSTTAMVVHHPQAKYFNVR